jgi:hypothetical protein
VLVVGVVDGHEGAVPRHAGVDGPHHGGVGLATKRMLVGSMAIKGKNLPIIASSSVSSNPWSTRGTDSWDSLRAYANTAAHRKLPSAQSSAGRRRSPCARRAPKAAPSRSSSAATINSQNHGGSTSGGGRRVYAHRTQPQNWRGWRQHPSRQQNSKAKGCATNVCLSADVVKSSPREACLFFPHFSVDNCIN